MTKSNSIMQTNSSDFGLRNYLNSCIYDTVASLYLRERTEKELIRYLRGRFGRYNPKVIKQSIGILKKKQIIKEKPLYCGELYPGDPGFSEKVAEISDILYNTIPESIRIETEGRTSGLYKILYLDLECLYLSESDRRYLDFVQKEGWDQFGRFFEDLFQRVKKKIAKKVNNYS